MLLLTDFGSRAIRMFGKLVGPINGTSPKLADLVHSGQFSTLLLTNFGSHDDLNDQGTPWSGYRDLTKTHKFGTFWPVFYAITH